MADLSKEAYYWSFSEDFPYADMWFLKSPVPLNASFLGGLLQRVHVGGFGSFDHFPKPVFYIPGPVVINEILALKGADTPAMGTENPIMPSISSDDSQDFGASLTPGTFPGVPGLNFGGNVDVNNAATIALALTNPTYQYLYPGLLNDLAVTKRNINQLAGCANVSSSSVYICISQLVARQYQLKVTTKTGITADVNASYDGFGLTVKYTATSSRSFTLDISAKDGQPDIVVAIGTSRWEDLVA